MFICRYFVLFIIFSFLGYLLEVIFCVVKEKRIDNRGFLYGPICPIYGVGALLMFLFFHIFNVYNIEVTPVKIFFISFFGSIVLEYFTSLILEKIFHSTWWDYSDTPLNIHGRVCIFYSFFFGIAGLVMAYVLIPYVEKILINVNPIQYEILSLIFMFLFASDIAITVNSIINFEELILANGSKINKKLEKTISTFNELRLNAISRIESVKLPKIHLKKPQINKILNSKYIQKAKKVIKKIKIPTKR